MKCVVLDVQIAINELIDDGIINQFDEMTYEMWQVIKQKAKEISEEEK